MFTTDKSKTLDVEAIRRDFPILSREVNGKPLIYLDNAATSQKPRQMIDALVRYYEENNANVHRGLHTLAEEATNGYEGAREKLAAFLGAKEPASIIFMRNTTEAINLIAYSWAIQNIRQGETIALSQMEHHSNLVPWQRAASAIGAHLRWIEVTPEGALNLDSLKEALEAGGVKLVAISHASNVLATINPVAEITELAHRYGALSALDGAQACPHMPVNVSEIDCDFYSVSAHKMLGPTGIGALYGKPEILEAMQPFLSGGSMISRVTFEETAWNEVPYKFEAGTPNIADAIAWGAAIDYLNRLGMENVFAHEQEIGAYALERLSSEPGVTVYGPKDPNERVGVVSFNIEGVHPHDVAQVLDSEGIAIRAGHHCCAPLMKIIGAQSTARASFYIYNRMSEVDALIAGIRKVRQVFSLGA